MTAVSAVALVALLVSMRAATTARRAAAAARAQAERVTDLEAAAATAASPPVTTGREPSLTTHTFTQVDHLEADAAQIETTVVAERIDGRLFADIVARETVVKAASWSHGIRRALTPESRNRIRFQVRQEAKRAGRERRAEMKEALRHYRARHRAVDEEDVA